MIANMTWRERVLRILLGLLLLAGVLVSSNELRWLYVIGVLPLVTGMVGWCPFYSVLKRLTQD